MSILDLNVSFVGPTLLHQRLDRRVGVLEQLFRFSQRSFNRMESFGNLSALLVDLHDPEIQLLQFDEGGQVLVQCSPVGVICGKTQGYQVRSTGGPTRTRT